MTFKFTDADVDALDSEVNSGKEADGEEVEDIGDNIGHWVTLMDDGSDNADGSTLTSILEVDAPDVKDEVDAVMETEHIDVDWESEEDDEDDEDEDEDEDDVSEALATCLR